MATGALSVSAKVFNAAAAPAPPATDAPESGGSDSGAAAAGQEMMDDVLTYFRSGVSQEAAEACGRPGDLVTGANVAGFQKVADAMLSEGLY